MQNFKNIPTVEIHETNLKCICKFEEFRIIQIIFYKYD